MSKKTIYIRTFQTRNLSITIYYYSIYPAKSFLVISCSLIILMKGSSTMLVLIISITTVYLLTLIEGFCGLEPFNHLDTVM
jgi:hypothetical protein